jgi:HTH-type transcriptional regulator, sugar sensing transcriptional regulator
MARRLSEEPVRADTDSGAIHRSAANVVAALSNLGFSQYEARTYAGLIGSEPLTGYAIAKNTQVPQPKVYETLGRLVERGAVLQVSDSPAKFIAVPPSRVLAELEASFRQRMSTLEVEISRARAAGNNQLAMRAYHEAGSWMSLADAARELIEGTVERLYVSGHSTYLEPLAGVITDADARGVRVHVLCFGEPPFSVKNGGVIRHSSTDGIVYRHHQARHLAIGCDGDAGLWALATDGERWEGIWSNQDPLLSALVKGFVRHDTFMQRVYADFSEEMRARYGAGLEGLFDGPSARDAGPSRQSTGIQREDRRFA